MGFELAKEAVKLGANVKLIIGPNNLDLKSYDGKLINVSNCNKIISSNTWWDAKPHVGSFK